MALGSLNYFAMIVGYISIFFILLIIIFFLYLYIKGKYDSWKWKKEREKSQKQAEEKEGMKEPTSAPAAESPPLQIKINN